MRQVTLDICSAFLSKVPSTKSNSYTDGTTLYLHNNAIAKHTEKGIMVTDADFPTNTTKERLNGLAELKYGKRPFHTKNHQLRDNRGEWDGSWKLLSECI